MSYSNKGKRSQVGMSSGNGLAREIAAGVRKAKRYRKRREPIQPLLKPAEYVPQTTLISRNAASDTQH